MTTAGNVIVYIYMYKTIHSQFLYCLPDTLHINDVTGLFVLNKKDADLANTFGEFPISSTSSGS